jgi:hypothetical protein
VSAGLPWAGLLWALGCGERTTLADETRALDRAEVGSRAVEFRATLRGWHHGPALAPPALPFDAVYVGWELVPADGTGGEPSSIRGDAEQVWEEGELERGRARYEALAIERCAAPERIAFRAIFRDEASPWRIAVADPAGVGVDVGPAAEVAPTCAEALAWAGEPDVWRRDRTRHAALCAHLFRLGRKDDAVRCLLRSDALPTRQALPRAPDDPEFDGVLLGVLAADAPGDRAGFASDRVSSLLAEVADRGAVARIAAGYDAGGPSLLPWQRALRGGGAASGDNSD